jgi:putative transposase
VVWSFAYLAVRKVLALIVLVVRSDRSKEPEILVLRHELAVLRRPSARPGFEPPTVRCWPRRVKRFHAGRGRYSRFGQRHCCAATASWWRGTGPIRTGSRDDRRLPGPRRDVILRLARENPQWGYQPIAGELKRLGLAVSATTVRRVLRAAGLPPAPERARQSWRSFLRQQAASTLACDFFTVETLALHQI